MGVLTDIPDNRIHTGKGWLVINPAFDAVLEIQKLYKEEGLTEYEKTGQALYMLVKTAGISGCLGLRKKPAA